jgi:hypothetical protein
MIINWEPNFSLYEVSNIWEYSFATGESRRITNVPKYTWIHQLSVSPDGTEVVYEYQPTGDWINRKPLELWIMNRDGSGQRRLVSNGRNPAWSPANIPQPNPVPLLNGISPASADAGGAAFTLTVRGSSFMNGSVVRWNGAALTTNYVDAATLKAQVPADKIAAAGTASVSVANPGPGGGESGPKTFTITANNPVPTLQRINPPSVLTGGTGYTLTIYGSGFVRSSQVRWNAVSLPTTYMDSTMLTVKVPADKVAKAGTAAVLVFNPVPGGGSSQPLTLTIIDRRFSLYLPMIIR